MRVIVYDLMRILQIHNSYLTPGGEDQVYAAEYELLTRRGHTVHQYTAHNAAITSQDHTRIAVNTVWNPDSYRQLKAFIGKTAPDVIHVHNTFPLISPAVYYAAATMRAPVVQTLHNYRLLCPAATLFRNGRVCEQCVGAWTPYRSIYHRCYRNSIGGSAALTAMLAIHRMAGTWAKKVHVYIALSEFSKRKFTEGGLPEDKIVVKPNFLAVDPGSGNGSGRYALFVGRLSHEKGLDTLVRAWKTLGSEIPLLIVGEGPLVPWVRQQLQVLTNVEWLGHCGRQRIFELMKKAAFLVFPSQCYEGLPMTIIEALACGTPVIASALGSINELVANGVNGYRFTAADSADLIRRVRMMLAMRDELHAMRRSSRAFYEAHFTSEENYPLLLEIYRRAVAMA